MSSRLAAIAAQTVEIVQNGHYVAPSGQRVTIADEVTQAMSGTRLHIPDDPLGALPPPVEPVTEVTPESTVEAGRRLGPGTVALVFASARNPGGGFLGGARAQEEDIARASALYACQRTAPEFYAYHRAEPDLRYSDRVIYSPDVPVFRDDDGSLLEQPYGLSFLTSAAPNLGAILRSQPQHAASVPGVLSARAERILRVAATHGHRRVVLGAWGCGVFRNSPEAVAAAFRAALAAVPCFEQVTFAVLDRQGTSPSRRVFERVFGAAAG